MTTIMTRMIKRGVGIALMLLTATTAWADDNGSCGNNVTYTFVESTGALTISGEGDMEDYGQFSDVPWYGYTSNIQTVVIESGVTGIGNNAFNNCTNLKKVYVLRDNSTSITTLGSNAFSGCTSLTEIFVPAAASYTYKIDTNWKDYKSKIKAFNGYCGDPNVNGGKNMAWSYDTSTRILTIAGTGPMSDNMSNTFSFSVQTIIIEPGVTSIGKEAFYPREKLISVTIPATVTSIGEKAFYNCINLITIDMQPTTPPTLGSDAFRGCNNLTNILVPADAYNTYQTADNWKEDDLFGKICMNSYCGASNVNGGKNVKWAFNPTTKTLWVYKNTTNPVGDSFDMGDYDTSNNKAPWYDNRANISTLIIKEDVKRIGDHAFNGCTNLKIVNVLRDNSTSITTLGSDAFDNTHDDLEIFVPSAALGTYKEATNWSTYSNNIFGFGYCGDTYYDANSIKNLIWEYNSTTTTLRIRKNTIDPVGDSFETKKYSNKEKAPWYGDRESIANLVIEDGVTGIGNSAFDGCTALTSDHITMASSVATIHPYAFIGCTGLTTAPIGSGVTYIGNKAFGDCTGLISAHIPAGVKEETYDDNGKRSYNGYFSFWAFDGCTSLTTITVAEDNPTFKGVDGVLMSKDGTDIIKYPQGKTATSYTIPASVERIIEEAFSGCSSLSSITIPSSVTNIGYSAFRKCTSLLSITIPASVTSINDAAFYDCSNLKTVNVLRYDASATVKITELGYDVFTNTHNDLVLYVHGAAYKTASNWSTYASKMTVLGTITPGTDVTASGTAILTSDGTNYYAEGTAITISYGGETTGYDQGFTVTKAGGGTVDVDVTDGISSFVMPADNVTVTATISPVSYAITYNLAGGTVATANPTTYTVVSEAITLNNPTRDGYTFAGWLGTGLDAATMTVTIAKGSTGARSYTATWRKLLTITAASDTKVYDGTALTNSSYTSEGLLEGDAIESVTVNGSQTAVGTCDNVASAAVIKNGDVDVTAQYIITYVKGTLTVTTKTVTAPTITLSETSYDYDGTAKTPTVTVKDGETTIPDTEYTVGYSDNTAVGKATVTVTDKEGGNYVVSGTATFTITEPPVPGDANGDKVVNVADIVHLVNHGAPQSDIDATVKIILGK